MRLGYTEQFHKSLNEMMACGHNYYSQRFLKNIFSEIRKVKGLLLDNPYMGSKEQSLENTGIDFRKIIILKQIKIIYFIEGEIIVLADLWDTRRNPDTLTSIYN